MAPQSANDKTNVPKKPGFYYVDDLGNEFDENHNLVRAAADITVQPQGRRKPPAERNVPGRRQAENKVKERLEVPPADADNGANGETHKTSKPSTTAKGSRALRLPRRNVHQSSSPQMPSIAVLKRVPSPASRTSLLPDSTLRPAPGGPTYAAIADPALQRSPALPSVSSVVGSDDATDGRGHQAEAMNSSHQTINEPVHVHAKRKRNESHPSNPESTSTGEPPTKKRLVLTAAARADLRQAAGDRSVEELARRKAIVLTSMRARSSNPPFESNNTSSATDAPHSEDARMNNKASPISAKRVSTAPTTKPSDVLVSQTLTTTAARHGQQSISGTTGKSIAASARHKTPGETEGSPQDTTASKAAKKDNREMVKFRMPTDGDDLQGLLTAGDDDPTRCSGNHGYCYAGRRMCVTVKDGRDEMSFFKNSIPKHHESVDCRLSGAVISKKRYAGWDSLARAGQRVSEISRTLTVIVHLDTARRKPEIDLWANPWAMYYMRDEIDNFAMSMFDASKKINRDVPDQQATSMVTTKMVRDAQIGYEKTSRKLEKEKLSNLKLRNKLKALQAEESDDNDDSSD